MGYHTEFNGRFNLDKALAGDQFEYFNRFAVARHMKRDVRLLDTDNVGNGFYFGWLRVMGGPGIDGEYYIPNVFDDERKIDGGTVVAGGRPPSTQPGLWCDWEASEDGLHIQWDGSEKFYRYIEWLVYIIEHFLKPWGYTLNGEVEWQGEESEDIGKIVVENNVVNVGRGHVIYEFDEPTPVELD